MVLRTITIFISHNLTSSIISCIALEQDILNMFHTRFSFLKLVKLLFKAIDQLQVRVIVIHDISIGISVVLAVKVVAFLVKFNLLGDGFPSVVDVLICLLLILVAHLHQIFMIFREGNLRRSFTDAHQHHSHGLDTFVLSLSLPLLLSDLCIEELL